ncbi:MAG: PspA/IM30 family protein [Eubacteriales bacterium]|nr:PspA/IM30 family protein [Eubacteriales bacterium]
MGLFKRLGTMIKGFFGRKISQIEESNPDILLEELKTKIEKTAREAEKQIVEVQTTAELIRIEMENSKAGLDRIVARMEAAKSKEDIDLLAELIIQEEDYRQAYEAEKEMYVRAIDEAAKIKSDYRIFESEINSRITELKTLKSKAKIAELRENIVTLNTKYSSKNKRLEDLNNSMEKAREVINIKAARANAYETLAEGDIELRLKRMDMAARREMAFSKARALIGKSEVKLIDGAEDKVED